ncbi:MAG TPA: DedA family protein [Lysinibacillus sp.]|uniref:DedA family protein n=1 Tax=Lysinibacillus fusiformis TaxID=28031 RepID=A0A2I0UUT9_9BACI|nr:MULTISPECIES: DedA family protein [Lysinibacillus]HBT71675.1 DedA family protein [Lysinibacillus sp.]KUF27800.1 alkaline phosphatase [Lysinibacillus sp. F5]PKU49778.1 DedA family protein [Lysinibacillus fusiformis]WCH47576.1 DedA family protein [Lysinibacillus sp. OF-1]SCY84237.1 membrane protein DedA, SNARE-associated domain [Lysinibacillus sp. SG9]
MAHHVQSLIEHYGYLGIIVILIGGIVGLPLPDEVFLTYVGYSVYIESLEHIPALVSAMIGAVGGITLSYYIGYRFGLPLLQKYGPKIHITEQKIDFTKQLFTKIGPTLLLIGYFIPGVRHLTAYIAAINNYPYRKFAFFAYTGAFIWTFTFITLGRMLGEKWRFVGYYLSHYSIYLILLFGLVMLIVYYLFKKRNIRK